MPSNLAYAHDETASILSETDSLPASDRHTSGSAEWHGEEGQRSFQIRIGRSNVRIETSFPGVPDWLTGVVTELNRVANLPPNWDSYGALAVGQRTLEHAFHVVVALMDVRNPVPQVGATVKGGVEFEWHSDGRDLEIQVEGPLQVHAYFYDENVAEEWEDEIDIELDRIKPYLDRLSR